MRPKQVAGHRARCPRVLAPAAPGPQSACSLVSRVPRRAPSSRVQPALPAGASLLPRSGSTCLARHRHRHRRLRGPDSGSRKARHTKPRSRRPGPRTPRPPAGSAGRGTAPPSPRSLPPSHVPPYRRAPRTRRRRPAPPGAPRPAAPSTSGRRRRGTFFFLSLLGRLWNFFHSPSPAPTSDCTPSQALSDDRAAPRPGAAQRSAARAHPLCAPVPRPLLPRRPNLGRLASPASPASRAPLPETPSQTPQVGETKIPGSLRLQLWKGRPERAQGRDVQVLGLRTHF
jgi:hypothetical protein